MGILSAEEIWSLPEVELLSMLDSGKLVLAPHKVIFYNPSFAYNKANPNGCLRPRFPTISITGNDCALGCKHCGGKVLETMYPARTPQNLFALARQLKGDGAVGCLVSGGCLSNGSVPLDRFTPVLRKMKRDLGLTVTVHTGIVGKHTAKLLKEAEVDAALIDIVGSDATLNRVFNLNVTLNRYEDSLRFLSEAGLRFVPHVIVGLEEGNLSGEIEALHLVRRFNPTALVIIAFLPIHGTEMEHVKPPRPVDVARVVTVARVMFPTTPLALGCMRPKGKHRGHTDVLALKAGVDAMAFPSEEALVHAEAMGMVTIFSPYCCSQIFVDIDVRSGSK